MGTFYRYVDLTNQQIFLRTRKRISKATWESWCDGISHTLQRPAFKDAWQRIGAAAPGDFAELRELERKGFTGDPAEWSEKPSAIMVAFRRLVPRTD